MNQKNDKSSLWNEVHNLIQFRNSNAALQSYGEIEFLQVGYPLVYKRSFQNQSIIAIINPADRKCCVEIPEGKIVYSVGGSGTYTHGTYLVDGATALFIEICKSAK